MAANITVAGWAAVSVSAFLAVLFVSFAQSPNFYSAAVYASKSNACTMALCNFGIFLAFLAGRGLQAIFFGSLRTVEVERLHERLWINVTEMLLALTIFREQFNATFVVLFISLLLLKSFHWLAADRVEFMEQSPNITTLFHIRLSTLFTILLLTDAFFLVYAFESILMDGPNVMIMFASEYTILETTLFATLAKYIINVIDIRSTEPWDNKSIFIFYIEVATDFVKLLTYATFFCLIFTFYGLPLNTLRDVYVTFRSLFIKLRDLKRFRVATRNMDERYPDATEQDLSRTDRVCIICREDMEVFHPQEHTNNNDPSTQQANRDKPKVLSCGHIFHFACLRSWLERQQSCPTCRRSVVQDPPNRNTTRNPDPSANNNQQNTNTGVPNRGNGYPTNMTNDPFQPQQNQNHNLPLPQQTPTTGAPHVDVAERIQPMPSSHPGFPRPTVTSPPPAQPSSFPFNNDASHYYNHYSNNFPPHHHHAHAHPPPPPAHTNPGETNTSRNASGDDATSTNNDPSNPLTNFVLPPPPPGVSTSQSKSSFRSASDMRRSTSQLQPPGAPRLGHAPSPFFQPRPALFPSSLSEAQIRTLSTLTRESIEQRVRILSEAQETIASVVDQLTAVLSTLPLDNTTPSSTSIRPQAQQSQQQQQQQQQQQTQQQSSMLATDVAMTTSVMTSSPVALHPQNSTLPFTDQVSSSSSTNINTANNTTETTPKLSANNILPEQQSSSSTNSLEKEDKPKLDKGKKTTEGINAEK